jgi:site-specific recombinase XerD
MTIQTSGAPMENQLTTTTETSVTETNPALVYLAGLSASGRRSMKQRLQLVDNSDWASMRYEHVIAIRTKLQEQGFSPASVNATLCALRGVAREAWNLGLMSTDTYMRIESVKGLRSSRLPSGRMLSAGEIAALFEACRNDATAAGRRDAAILGLLLGAGLRRSECAELKLADFNADEGSLKVRGKGDKERMVYLNNGALDAVLDWLSVRGNDEGCLITRVSQAGIVQSDGLTSQAIYNALSKRAKEAKVSRFSPHDLRRTTASNLIDLTGDLSAVQSLLGHASVNTTVRYDRRGEAAKKKAAGAWHLPYRR